MTRTPECVTRISTWTFTHGGVQWTARVCWTAKGGAHLSWKRLEPYECSASAHVPTFAEAEGIFESILGVALPEPRRSTFVFDDRGIKQMLSESPPTGKCTWEVESPQGSSLRMSLSGSALDRDRAIRDMRKATIVVRSTLATFPCQTTSRASG